jgi:hypothetical protein
MSNLRHTIGNQGLVFYNSSPVLTLTLCLYFLKGPRTMEAALEHWMLTVCWSHPLTREAGTGAMEARPEAMEARPGTMDARPVAVKARPGAMNAFS